MPDHAGRHASGCSYCNTSHLLYLKASAQYDAKQCAVLHCVCINVWRNKTRHYDRLISYLYVSLHCLLASGSEEIPNFLNKFVFHELMQCKVLHHSVNQRPEWTVLNAPLLSSAMVLPKGARSTWDDDHTHWSSRMRAATISQSSRCGYYLRMATIRGAASIRINTV